MDFAGASRTLHAVRRLLGVALLALALTTAVAQAQVQAPPSTAPDQTLPDQTGEPGDDVGDGGYDHDPDWTDDHAPDWSPADSGGVRPGALPDTGGADDWDETVEEELPRVSTVTVAGREARMRTDGKAAVPLGAPQRVRALIGQYNRIVGKRYKWGGGHAKLVDTGYDCSGAVGYGLIKGGMLRSSMVSGSFTRWGAAGEGRWVTVYAHKGHVYVEVAGLRLDTSAVGDRDGASGVRWRPVIGPRRGFKARHPVGL